MSKAYVFVIAATLAVSACDKQEEAPAAEAPATEQAVEEAKPGEEAKPEEGAAAKAEEGKTVEAMVATVDKPAPAFELADAIGKTHKLADYKGKIVVLEWTSPECPVVRRVYENDVMQKAVAGVGEEVVWLAVDSSHFNKPEDSAKWKEAHKLSFPVLQDTDGKIGKAYAAKTTPHMFVIDKDGTLRYQGAIDNDPHGKAGDDVKNYVVEAVKAIAEGKEVQDKETKPYGCSVKYDKS